MPDAPAVKLRFHDFTPEYQKSFVESFQKAGEETMDLLRDFDRRLTNTNLLSNGGAAAAVVALHSQGAVPVLLDIALALFAVGVIATGVELRAMLIYFSEIGKLRGAMQRKFTAGEIPVEGLYFAEPLVAPIWRKLNHGAGLASQVAFALGVLCCALGFLLTPVAASAGSG